MTRIIGGSARGTKLSVPPKGTRPTSDRIREALFSSLESWLAANNKTWDAICFVDLYSGSGAIGLEAASRGASEVTLVEQALPALRTIHANAIRTNLTVRTERSDVSRWNPPPRVDIVFLDPPYSMSDQEISSSIVKLTQSLDISSTLCVVERGAKSGDPFSDCERESFEKKWDKAYGDSRLWYGHLVGGDT